MYIAELFDPTPHGYHSEEDDQSSPKITASRKTRLTLAQLNKLRTLNDVRKFEHEEKKEKIKNQYAIPAQSMGGPGM
jgi:hypothetical protein